MRHFPNFANFVTQENTVSSVVYTFIRTISWYLKLSLLIWVLWKLNIQYVMWQCFSFSRKGVAFRNCSCNMSQSWFLKDKITIVHIVQVKKKNPEKGIFPYFYESECFSLHLRNSATWFMAGYREHLPVHTYSPWWSLNRPNVLINFSGEFNVSLDNRAMQKTAENLQ